MCLAGAVVASMSLTQDVAGSNLFTLVTNILSQNLLYSVKTFRENSNNSNRVETSRGNLMNYNYNLLKKHNYFKFSKSSEKIDYSELGEIKMISYCISMSWDSTLVCDWH